MPLAELEKTFRAELAKRFERYEAQYLPTQTLKPTPANTIKTAKTPREQVRSGLGALAAGDLDTARKALEKARAFPKPSISDQADTLFLAGEIALARRDADAAVAAFEGLLDVGPPRHDGYDVRVRLGLAELHRKRPDAAAEHLRRAAAFDPIRVEPHALLAELYGSQQRKDDRLAALEAAVRLDPQSDTVAKELVFGVAKAGRSTRVLELAPIAIFIDPADPDLHAALGRALAATGKTAAAAAALERALVFRPRDPIALHLTLATLYDRLGNPGKAAAHRSSARNRD
jgi:tetratricopeptide (TPR) repeat protein